MILTLTGFMGSGKSCVGRELSSRLGWEFTDLDRYIEHKMGQTIPEIFKDGEERFRAIEAEALRDLVVMSQVTGKDIVISLGGGTITIGSARRLILEQTTCIYLRTDLDTIFKRLGTRSKSRPLFHDKLKVEEAYVVHMSHHVQPHEKEAALMPTHRHLAYDGMEFSCEI